MKWMIASDLHGSALYCKKMIKRQRFSSNRGSRCLFCLADNPTLLTAAPRFLSHASFIKEQVLLHAACFQPELRERVLPGKLVPAEPFDPDRCV